MARVIVTKNGRPVNNVRVNANTTTRFLLSDYDRKGVTDQNGVCELLNGENRYYILVNGRRVETVNKLLGTIEVTIGPLWFGYYYEIPKPPANTGGFFNTQYLTRVIIYV